MQQFHDVVYAPLLLLPNKDLSPYLWKYYIVHSSILQFRITLYHDMVDIHKGYYPNPAKQYQRQAQQHGNLRGRPVEVTIGDRVEQLIELPFPASPLVDATPGNPD